ncbi:MAG: hypothetical protein IJS50_04545 [Desulfovibrio sp.]|nr:hypothetical protein [Desulfovibrio sp.]
MEAQEKPTTKSNPKDHLKQDDPKWYEGKNKEIVIYYLIAVFFLEIIVGTTAFFYGVAHPIVSATSGQKFANFPWVGWAISACLTPVALLLLFHLSGWFFTRSLNEGQGANSVDSAKVPENVRLIYSMLSNAPVIVILLGLIALGAALYFLDTALGTLRPYIPWILGSATVFLIICYIARLIFLARHNRLEREYAYRMHVFEKSGIIITDKMSVPLTAEDIVTSRNALASQDTQALPAAEQKKAPAAAEDDAIVDATIVEKDPKDSQAPNDPTAAKDN